MKNQEPQPIVLPSSNMRRHAASAVTVRDLPIRHSLANCKRCDGSIEPDACYCGHCGMQLRFSISERV